MAVKLRRPILVGGVGLAFSLWLLQSVQDSVNQLSEFGVVGLMAVGAGLWLFQQRTQEIQLPQLSSPVNRERVEKAIAEAAAVITRLEAEAENSDFPTQLRQQVAQVATQMERQEIQLSVAGGKGVGKTTLIRVLAANWVPQMPQKLGVQEISALFTQNADEEAENTTKAQAFAADLVLFVTNGDLTEPEFQTLQQLRQSHLRTLLVFNKQDQYLPEEGATVLQQLRQQMQGLLATEDVMAVAASPSPIKVRKYQLDHSVQEWMEQPTADLTSLTTQLSLIIPQEGEQLVWTTTWRTAVALKAAATTALNGVRRNRALPVIEQYQWIAAATAFANPVPALDLLATAAINAQLVMELGTMYQQKFSLQQAQTAAGTLGSLMLKLGLVELSTQTIGSILKGNAVTFVAGGLVQGVSAAYLTRLAGLSLIEYFQMQEVSITSAESPFHLDQLRQTLQRVFQQNQRTAFLQSFVKQAVGHLNQLSVISYQNGRQQLANQ